MRARDLPHSSPDIPAQVTMDGRRTPSLAKPHGLAVVLAAQTGHGAEGSTPFLDAFQWIGQVLLWPLVIVLLVGAVWFVVSRLRRRP